MKQRGPIRLAAPMGKDGKDGERWGWGEGGKDGKMMSERPLDVALAEIFRHALFFPNMLR